MNGVIVWWVALSTLGVLNIALWTGLRRRVLAFPSPAALAQLRLSAGFVFGCAFRSFLPRADVQRICLADTWLSSVVVGRSVATIAELCFMAQCALTLRRFAQEQGSPRVVLASRFVVPMIAFAETCSWTAVLTSDYLGNVIEESTWTVVGALLLVMSVALLKQAVPSRRRGLTAAIVLAAGYLAFMTNVDVPMYLARWHADTQAGKAYLSLWQSLVDVSTRWRVTTSMAEWREELPWMSLYFSVAVWASLWMTRLAAKARPTA